MPRRSPAPKPERTLEEREHLLLLADHGDADALSEISYIHHDIDDTGIDDGDLAARAERAVIELATSTTRDHAALARSLARMRTELDGPAPTPTERLLVDRVVTCSVWLSCLDERLAQAFKERDTTAQRHLERLVDGAHRRYLLALKTLAQVRRLIVPVVQLNLAKQQVNVVVASSDGQLHP